MSELQKLGALREKHNIWIVADEVYSELVYNPVKHISVATLSSAIAARTIVATSVSKSFAMTGWRLGYCITPFVVQQRFHNGRRSVPLITLKICSERCARDT
ncbi:MAG: hypothetical protein CK528_02105 [Alcaligenaceae bacterium]|nr:MAG: hypothetical protein CK528_02105 [Alcaligenaceae bacterium]